MKGEAQALADDLADAERELADVRTWKTELHAVRVSGDDASALQAQEDQEAICEYEAELKREVKALRKHHLDARSFALNLRAQAKVQSAFEIAARSRPAKKALLGRPPPAPKPSLAARTLPQLTCIKCRKQLERPWPKRRLLYCSRCRRTLFTGNLAKELQRRRAALSVPLRGHWPGSVSGPALQGGAPGLGKKA